MPNAPTAITPVQNRTEVTRRRSRRRGSRGLLDCAVSGLSIAALSFVSYPAPRPRLRRGTGCAWCGDATTDRW